MEQAYIPKSNEELWARAEAMKWLTIMEWPQVVVLAIMRYENPDIETVRRLVYRHGPDEALKLVVRFTFGVEVKDVCEPDDLQ